MIIKICPLTHQNVPISCHTGISTSKINIMKVKKKKKTKLKITKNVYLYITSQF